MLQALGVTEPDEVLYTTLLRTPGITAEELADAGCVAVATVRRGLQRLEGLGLVTRLAGSPVRFNPVRPDIAVEVLVAMRQRELSEAQVAARTLMAEMAAENRQDPAEVVEIVAGREAVAHRFRQMEGAVSQELLVLDKPPYSMESRESTPSELALLERGVSCRGIYLPEGLEIPGRMSELARLMAAGEEARVSRTVPMKLAIADRAVALLPLSYERITDQALVVRGLSLVNALVALFEMLWQLAVPIEELAGDDIAGSVTDGPFLAEPQRRLLTLLTAGLSDKAIAREMNISARTLSRQLAALTEMLGARTRFQAGIQASRRGLI
jgi:DNA-binding CsgD family transcriptional regulator